MNPPPLARPAERVSRAGGYLGENRNRARRPPTPGGIARRRWLITTIKFLLPTGALLLLASLALWPEFDRAKEKTRVVMRGFSGQVDGARVANARYNGMDQRGRPFTITAATAGSGVDQERVDLTSPAGDMRLEDNTWLMLRSRRGVFMRKIEQLDLSGDVVLYRDDGTTMTTQSATMEIKSGAAISAETTHVEGPFGTLDATGFTTVEKGTAIQFWGPARATLNGVTR